MGHSEAEGTACCVQNESDEEWQETVDIVRHYQFPHCHISQMYVRPGTPAAKMKKVTVLHLIPYHSSHCTVVQTVLQLGGPSCCEASAAGHSSCHD